MISRYDNRKKRKPVRFKLRRAALAAAAVGLVGAVASPCAAASASISASAETAPVTRSGGPSFVVYDNAAYRNVNLERYGAVKSNIVYEGQVAQLTRQQAKGSRDEDLGYRAELALPPRHAYEALVRSATQNPGPVVLDFESLYLRGSYATAYRHYRRLETLLAWAHDAARGHAIGFYGVLGNTAPRYFGLERRLARQQDALFPSLYTFSDDLSAWRRRFRQIMAEAADVAPGKPVLAYIRPQYHDGTRQAGQYLTPNHWRYELRVARELCSGVVIWGPHRSVPDQRWVEVTQKFLGGPLAV
jgi:hypothetical protein